MMFLPSDKCILVKITAAVTFKIRQIFEDECDPAAATSKYQYNSQVGVVQSHEQSQLFSSVSANV